MVFLSDFLFYHEDKICILVQKIKKSPENVVLSGKFLYSYVKYALSFKLLVIGICIKRSCDIVFMKINKSYMILPSTNDLWVIS